MDSGSLIKSSKKLDSAYFLMAQCLGGALGQQVNPLSADGPSCSCTMDSGGGEGGVDKL